MMIERAIAAALRPLARRIENMLARAVVTAVMPGNLQVLQVNILAGETKDGVQHFEPAGFTSHPMAGAEGLVVFPDGVRTHGIAVVVTDRRHRPTDLQPGEAALFCHADGLAQVRVMSDGLVLLKGKKLRTEFEDIEHHASKSISWDVNGFGERWTWVGGTTWEHKTWQQGATVTSVTLSINPPEGP